MSGIAESGDQRWLVVGLGNPGPEYAGNRHNAGFMVVEELAARMGGRFKVHKSRAEIVEGRSAGARAVLAKPLSYMNLSGGPVKALADFYKVAPVNVIVIHDELDIPYGALRTKLGGGDNGHNGLKSITKSLGTKDYPRIRFGIGRPPGRMDPAAYVLKDFATAERKDLPFLVDRAADMVESLITSGVEATQNRFHAGDLNPVKPPR
ncbi:peptidyl-tRNA hydrolase [Planotetraspora silvatica]|uniref:Peptidyl-tRNA hydrolase n=1 Tax=Planotetraspora silvatica TaxID=234614 RepID=A0A8J3XLI4_9ACTN|nr:aminoacyl-tRNA hydrolase [Planotetraspora silvatica]GII45200.1 peptidyl-tRNA hydrolase [Planotetraspora silvatica]